MSARTGVGTEAALTKYASGLGPLPEAGEKPSVDLSPGDPAVERLPACDGAVLLGGQLVGGSFSRRSLLPPGPAAGLSWDSERPGA